MALNTQQLQYLVEIERTRSISQAAANLYMGQPNLSRILRDTENDLGFSIFERTRKGVRPTEKGAKLLQHARNILREADFIERLGPHCGQPNRFRICLPRSFAHFDSATVFLRTLCAQDKLDAMIKECHPRQALELLDSCGAEVAVIRYSVEYQDYFSEQAEQRELILRPLGQLTYQLVLADSHPLAGQAQIPEEALLGFTEISHRDTFYPSSKSGPDHCRLYTVDRMAQFQLLLAVPGAYLWSEPLPAAMLERHRLVQRPCREGGARYQDALAYKPRCTMSESETGFLSWIMERYGVQP